MNICYSGFDWFDVGRFVLLRDLKLGKYQYFRTRIRSLCSDFWTQNCYFEILGVHCSQALHFAATP